MEPHEIKESYFKFNRTRLRVECKPDAFNHTYDVYRDIKMALLSPENARHKYDEQKSIIMVLYNGVVMDDTELNERVAQNRWDKDTELILATARPVLKCHVEGRDGFILITLTQSRNRLWNLKNSVIRNLMVMLIEPVFLIMDDTHEITTQYLSDGDVRSLMKRSATLDIVPDEF